ncbi:MAG: methyltransferase domain-containing protein [Bacteroidota bacterium]
MTTTQQHLSHQQIVEYYEEAGMDYRAWSKNFNMHFGYYKWGQNPFNLESMLVQMNEEVYQRMGIERVHLPTILDAGCGLGTTSRYIARKRSDALLYGVTITPWQIKEGEKKNEAAGLQDQVIMLKADYQALPVADESFDGAFALESSCYAKGLDKRPFLAEMYRVLRSGSQLVITDGFMKKSKPFPKIINWLYRKCTKNWALTDFANLEMFLAAMKSVGFSKIKVEDASWKIALSVLHIPRITFQFYFDLLKKGESWQLSKERRGNVVAPILGMLLGIARPYFGYYIITAQK